MTSAPTCSQCGAELRPGVRFCGACGTPIEDQASLPATPFEPGIEASDSRGTPRPAEYSSAPQSQIHVGDAGGPAQVGSRAPLLIGLAVAAAIVLAGGFLLLRGGSSNDSPRAGAASQADATAGANSAGGANKTVTVAGVIQTSMPSAWASKDIRSSFKGTQFAVDPADFDRAAPDKARLRILYINDPSAAANPQDVLKSMIPAADRTSSITPVNKQARGAGSLESYETQMLLFYGAKPVIGSYAVVLDKDRKRLVLFAMEMAEAYLRADSAPTKDEPIRVYLDSLNSAAFK